MQRRANRDEMIKEANKRLKMIEPSGCLAAEFRKGNVHISQVSIRASEETDAEFNPKLFERIKEIEFKYDVVVYHVIRSWWDNRDGGYDVIDSMLVVTNYMNEWQVDRNQIRDWNIVLAYAMNHAHESFSEFGEIQYGVDEDGVLYRM